MKWGGGVLKAHCKHFVLLNSFKTHCQCFTSSHYTQSTRQISKSIKFSSSESARQITKEEFKQTVFQSVFKFSHWLDMWLQILSRVRENSSQTGKQKLGASCFTGTIKSKSWTTSYCCDSLICKFLFTTKVTVNGCSRMKMVTLRWQSHRWSWQDANDIFIILAWCNKNKFSFFPCLAF